ncbi:MAG: MFS transporter [Acidobacteriota bacterium]|nr:MAG: MFS transporter [Acidobacteriota bacterium]
MKSENLLSVPKKNDRREIFGWLMYDWANSAFYTTVISVLLGPYLTALAQNDVGMNGVVFSLGWLGSVTAESLVPYSLALSVVSQVLFLPLLGSIADYTHLKKKMMAFFCYLGVTASSLLFFISGDSYLFGCALMIVANMSFAAANVFYNAFLVDLTTEDQRDKISSYGFATGYLGGVIMLAANLVLIESADSIGLGKAMAVRISMLAASLWWGAFGLITFLLVRSRNATKVIPEGKRLVAIGFSELWQTLKELVRLKYTALFLIAYLFYNDGIQTVILNSSVFLSQELFVRNGLETDQAFLLGIFMLAQISALVGSLSFERLARVIGAKYTIIVSLGIWCGIVIFAYAGLESRAQAWVLGAFIGLVLGSAQALSRSLYSQMIPKDRESAFFGLYEISEKGTSWLGNFVFAVVVASTGSYRQAILGLIIFFVVGMVLLVFTNTARAIHEAGNLTPEEAAEEH